MTIPGPNAYQGGSSVCIVIDEEWVAQQRNIFGRIKQWAEFPSESITYCLKEAGMRAGDRVYTGKS